MVTDVLLDERLKRYDAVCTQARPRLNRSFQREIIFKTLAATDTHPTAEEVYERAREYVPTLSLGTVYKNLGVLKDLGLIQEVHPGKGPVRYDANMQTHHHFVCEVCHSVEDIPEATSFKKLLIQPHLSAHQVSHFKVVFHGICHQCPEQRG